MKIAIASSTDKEDLKTYGRIVHMEDLVDEAASSGDADASKPDGDIFAAALRKLEYAGITSDRSGRHAVGCAGSRQVGYSYHWTHVRRLEAGRLA